MESKELKEIVGVINNKKRLSTKKLAEKLELNYPYLTLMMSGKHKPSPIYVNRIMDYAAENNLKMTEYTTKDLESFVKEEPNTNYTSSSKAMLDGSIFEITTTMRISNDTVTGYNINLKRIK